METNLKQQFDDMGIEPNQETLDKCIELCTVHGISDASEFVEKWLAFSISHLQDTEPTVDNLLEFERKILQVKRDKHDAKHSRISSNTSLNASTVSQNILNYEVNNDNDMLDDYVGDVGATGESNNSPMLSGKYSSLPRTPARQYNDRVLFNRTQNSNTPRTHLPTEGSGKIVYTFGNSALINNASWSMKSQTPIKVKQLLQHNNQTLDSQSKYMFDQLIDKAEITADRIYDLGRGLCLRKFGETAENYELSRVDERSQDIMKTIGVIFNDDYEAPLDVQSTLLMGSDVTICRSTRLNFSSMKSVGLFPGQVVMVIGTNPRGDVLMVKEIFAEQNIEQPIAPRLTEPLTFVVAAGPYTHTDDLLYEPLNDLLVYLKEQTPHVLILTGPFMDANHKLIADGITLTESFEIFFEKIIKNIAEAVDNNTTILIVASHLDACADSVYPTMPISLIQKYSNIIMLPDPSMLDLNGLVIGVTSTDIFDHLSTQELAVNAGDKVKRIVNYLLHQKSFYPISPPKEDAMCFDTVLAEAFAKLDQIPNILILPSDQKCFLRVVNGCLAINPGRVHNEKDGGTFARFVVNPIGIDDENNAYNYIGCQVCKVY